MATIEELEARLALLTARVDGITAPPETYYTMQYQGETIDRLLSMAPDNLLDNVNFQNPVNQHGVSGTISTAGFFIDRWYLVSGSVQLTSAGLVLDGTMRQTREFAVGAPTTASALTTSGVVAASYDDNTKVFTLTGTGQTFVTAKLELGDVSTVGYQNSNGVWHPSSVEAFAITLQKCQRYNYVTSVTYMGPQFRFYGESENRLLGILPFPVQMRTTPTVSGFPITFRDNNNGSQVIVDSAQYFVCETGLTLWYSLNPASGLFVDGHMYSAISKIAFSAEP